MIRAKDQKSKSESVRAQEISRAVIGQAVVVARVSDLAIDRGVALMR